MTGNDFMSWVLRSPFHGMLSNGMMLITVTGRKTGQKYTTPVSFYREDEYLWVITSRDRTWWKNLEGGADVSLLIKRKSIKAFGETELDPKVVEARLYQYLAHFPQIAKAMGISMDGGKANPEDIARTAKARLFVRFSVLPGDS